MEREQYTIAVCESDTQGPDYKRTSYGVGGWPDSYPAGRVFISPRFMLQISAIALSGQPQERHSHVLTPEDVKRPLRLKGYSISSF